MLKVKILSSLAKVFADEEPLSAERASYSMLKNERISFQAAFCSDIDTDVTASVEGEMSGCMAVYAVKDVPVGLAAFENSDDYYLRKTSGNYPDILMPVNKTNAKAGVWYSFWFEAAPGGNMTGRKTVVIRLNDIVKEVSLDIKDFSLPEKKIVYTNWFHCDAICDYYNVEPFTGEFWRIFGNFAKTASLHGQNCILTPLFTPALDTAPGGERTTVQLIGVRVNGGRYTFDFSRLRKWVEICRSLGIEYFELCHFFTQWGAKHAPKIVATDSKGREKKIFGWKTRTSSKKYDDFLRQFSRALRKFIDGNGLRDNVFIHISDEPSGDQLKVYRKRAKLIREIFPGYRVMDALSEYDFYKSGSVDIPVPSVGRIETFYGKADPLWTYYCCGQGNCNLPNRFIAMPSLRNRVLGVLLYRYNASGFLQWGYNFYNTSLSLKRINPYEVTDAGGAFPSGDSFIVYPGKDGEAICSLRLKVLYEGFCDLAALRALEEKEGREKVLELTGDISMENYPHDDEWLLSLRERINALLCG